MTMRFRRAQRSEETEKAGFWLSGYPSILWIMKIALIGDSLTAGNLGVAYHRYLSTPEHLSDGMEIDIYGRDGDTIAGMESRLDGILEKKSPDLLLLEGGANDILLPEMLRRDPRWAAFTEEMARVGSRPAVSEKEFSRSYRNILSTARRAGVSTLVCVTIPPLGEDNRGEHNIRRRVLNDIIRSIAVEYSAELADAAGVFEKALAQISTPSDYFFSSAEEFAADLRRIRRDRSAMPLSEERGLFFTVDGAHLNEEGARMMGEELSRAIAAALGTED